MRQDAEHEGERVAVPALVGGISKRGCREPAPRSVIAGSQLPASTARLVGGSRAQVECHIDRRGIFVEQVQRP